MPGCFSNRWPHRGPRCESTKRVSTDFALCCVPKKTAGPLRRRRTTSFTPHWRSSRKTLCCNCLSTFLSDYRPVRRRFAGGFRQRRPRGDRAPPPRPLSHRRRRHRRRRGARDDAERTTCGVGDEVAARPPSPRWPHAGASRRSRGAARQAGRSAGRRHPRRHRRQRMAGGRGLRDRGRTAGALPG